MNGDIHPKLKIGSHLSTIGDTLAASWPMLCVAVVCTGDSSVDARSSPFVTRDIALVYLAAAIPCGLLLGRVTADLLDVSLRWVVAAACWSVATLALFMLLVPNGLAGQGFNGLIGYATRPLLALLLVAPSVWAWKSCVISQPNPDARRILSLFTTLLVALMLPASFVTARCRQESIRFSELSDQSRLGEAATIAHRVLRLAPWSVLRGQPIARATADIDRAVRQLEAAVADVLPVDASTADRLQRARQLAVLGRTDVALQILETLKADRPDASVLAGTIYETREEWGPAFANYFRARELWQSRSASVDRTTGLIRAINGTAYSLRKQGRYADAERAYAELLELSPTAETHFLLAQFYEDTQQTTLARQHTQRAIELAPDRFERPGRQLIHKLATSHFGCFHAFLD